VTFALIVLFAQLHLLMSIMFSPSIHILFYQIVFLVKFACRFELHTTVESQCIPKCHEIVAWNRLLRQYQTIRVISRNLKLGGYIWMLGGVQTCAKNKFTLKNVLNRINYTESASVVLSFTLPRRGVKISLCGIHCLAWSKSYCT